MAAVVLDDNKTKSNYDWLLLFYIHNDITSHEFNVWNN